MQQQFRLRYSCTKPSAQAIFDYALNDYITVETCLAKYGKVVTRCAILSPGRTVTQDNLHQPTRSTFTVEQRIK
mgnify:CR=1 FL=1